MSKYKIVTEFDSANIADDCTQQEVEKILLAFERYGVRRDKFMVVDAPVLDDAELSEATRAEVTERLADARMSHMFGDGLERDYIYDGTTIVGLNEMSDTDLVDELESIDGEDDELVVKARTELGIDNIIRN